MGFEWCYLARWLSLLALMAFDVVYLRSCLCMMMR
jgi:hypothetical protein